MTYKLTVIILSLLVYLCIVYNYHTNACSRTCSHTSDSSGVNVDVVYTVMIFDFFIQKWRWWLPNTCMSVKNGVTCMRTGFHVVAHSLSFTIPAS